MGRSVGGTSGTKQLGSNVGKQFKISQQQNIIKKGTKKQA